MATILLGVIGCLIGLLSKHIIYFTLIGLLIGYRIDSQACIMTITFGVLGAIVGALIHHIMIIPFIGLIIGFFIDKAFVPIIDGSDDWTDEYKARQAEENERKFAENHVNNKLSESVRTYFQTGRVNENYYSCYNFTGCSPKINAQMNELLNDCREKLLLQVRNMKAVKDYNTPSGTIREVYVSGIVEHVHYWEHEESIHQPNTIGFNGYCIHVYRGSTGAAQGQNIGEKF